MTRPDPTAVLAMLLALALGLALAVTLDRCTRPLPLAVGLDVPAGTTRVLDAGRAPSRADTAGVSGTGGSVAAVRIEYRDRWRALPVPACPDGSPAVADTVVRVVVVPAEVPAVVALPHRPVRVTPSRAVLTYREAEGANAGRTVQEVYRVPRERLRLWADVGAALDVDTGLGAGPPFGLSPYHPELSARLGLDVRPGGIPGTVGIEAEVSGRPLTYRGGDVRAQVGLRWRFLDARR